MHYSKLLSAGLVSLFLSVTAPAVYAHSGDGKGGETCPYHTDGKDKSERKLSHLTEELKLSDKQQTQVKAILDEQKSKFETLRDETDKKIDEVLNKKQKAKYEKMKKERAEKKECRDK